MNNISRRTFLGLAAVSPWAFQAAAESAPTDLKDILYPILKTSGVPALAAAAMKNGKVLASGAMGLRKVGAVSPVTISDKFHIGSNTKAMTATLAGMLVEEDKLQWNQTLADFFPERASKIHADYRKVTLEMLLTHRAGLPANGHNYGQPNQPVQTQRLAYLDSVLVKAPEKEPGTDFLYSNAGFIIAGTILERITGKSWEELIRERLFRPLGMNSAGFGSPSKPNQTDQPWGHVFKDGKFVPSYGDNPRALGPAGTVHCTVLDYLKFADFHASVGKSPAGLLKPEIVKRLQTPGAGRTYAMGWGTGKRDWAKGRVLTHSGSNTKNYFITWVAPETGFSIAVASNAVAPKISATLDEVCGKLVKQFAV